jgi:hypothetical protein
VALTLTNPAFAGVLTGGAGFDYQTGPSSQSYRSALLFGYAEGASWDLTLAGIRYGDSRLGPGLGLFANGSLPIVPHVRVRGIGLRAVGDDSYRAWRWRLGPEFRLPADRVLGAYYLGLTNNIGDRFGSAGVEVTSPIAPNVTGQIGGSYGTWAGGATSTQGSLSGIWHPLGRLILLAEFDVGRNLATTSTSGPSGGGGLGGIPILGGIGNGRGRGGETSQTSSDVTEAGQIGIRFLLR